MSAQAPTFPGSVCVVTGTTSGIGEVTARELARRGGRLVLVARSAARAEAVASRIRDELSGVEVDAVIADLARLGDVRRAAAAIGQRHGRVDVLVNNAGLVNLRREVTEDGHEMVFAVNHLAPFLLTRLLEAPLHAAPAARVVNVASEAHRFGGIDLDDPGYAHRRWRPMQAYGQSKLANILFTRELARRWAQGPVTANCLHPGAVATGLGTNNGWFGRLAMGLLGPLFKTPEQGAETTIHLATSPDRATTSGEYFADCRPKRPSSSALDDDLALRLWRASEAWTGLHGPIVRSVD
ncbi:MAG: SDR family oxidoreductase [Myxococcota bacterium]